MNHQEISPDKCVACTSCMVRCPVSAVTREFLGPKMVGPVLTRFRGGGQPADAVTELCSNCKNCDITCPSGVPVSTLNVLAKADYYRTHPHSRRDWALSHGRTMSRLASPLAALSNLAVSNPLGRAAMKAAGFTDRMALPRFAGRTFERRFRALRQQSFPDKVIFFPGCYIDAYDPQVGIDLVAVMQAGRFEVVVPEGLQCCGTPLVANGYLYEAREVAGTNARILKEWVDRGHPVVAACTSCSLMLKRETQELFDLPGVPEVAARVYDALELIQELQDQGRLPLDPRKLSGSSFYGSFLYHAPCHLRAQGIGRPGLELLQSLGGIEVKDADAGCCGLSGSYGFKREKYEIAQAVGKELFDKIRATNAEAVLSECGTCRHQIAQATGARTLHPLSVLRRACG
jgi:glycerol-3-phosphate dehydrogenase subunit C